MKSITVPKFSDRYQALVDAERQYVVDTQRQADRNRPTASNPGIEAAFRLARIQNRADKNKDASVSG